MEYIIHFLRDDQADVWVATNDDIPLTLESTSLDELMNKVRHAVPELVELNHLAKPKTLYFLVEHREEVCADG